LSLPYTGSLQIRKLRYDLLLVYKNVFVKKGRRRSKRVTFPLQRDMLCAGYISATLINADKMSKCYSVNNRTQCFYSDSSVLMSWDEAREFCARRNSTLPIITDKDVDNVFQQFIVSDSHSLIQNRSVWIAAHARPVNNSVSWHWIDGQQSGRPTIITLPQNKRSAFHAKQLTTYTLKRFVIFNFWQHIP